MTHPVMDMRVIAYLASIFGINEVQKQLGCPAACGACPAKTAKSADNDDDFDLFGDETEEDKAAKAALVEKAKAAASAKKPKKVVIDKSTLVIEVKPNSADTNLDTIEKGVRSIAMDGLEWSKVSKKVPIAFGLFKLQIGCIIEDAKIDTTQLTEAIEMLGMNEEEKAAFQKRVDGGDEEEEEEDEDAVAPGWVQSAEIVSFQKL